MKNPKENFQIEIPLNKSVVSVSGYAEYYSNCDCDGRPLHPHIQDLVINWDKLRLYKGEDETKDEGVSLSKDEVCDLFPGQDFEDLVSEEIYKEESK